VILVDVVAVAMDAVPDEPKSRVLAESEESGNTYGSDATLHHEEVDDDDDESLLFSQGRGPFGNENDAIATPPPNTTETHGGSSSSMTLALSVVAVEELSAVADVVALVETVTIISCSKNDVPPILRSNNADVKSIMELARRTPP